MFVFFTNVSCSNDGRVIDPAKPIDGADNDTREYKLSSDWR
jgi:hypothetical protein